MSKTKLNLIYNMTYQLLIMIQPLIIAPYISRVLGSEQLGIYSYTFSIANYFVLFAMLGLNNFGNRSISRVRDDIERLSSTFTNIYMLQLITGTIAVIAYIFLIIFSDNKLIFLLQLFYVLSATFDITWFFFGMEQFKLTVLRNSIIKILTLVCVIAFVKNTEDLWLYTLIMSLGSLLSQLSLWPFVKKHISFCKPAFKEVKDIIRPNLIMFIPVISISLYKQMDKIMLGNFSSMREVGVYENATKLNSVPLAFVVAFSTVMLPKMSNIVAQGDIKLVKEYIAKSTQGVMFFSCAAAFGLAAIAQDFAPLFFGEEFEKTGSLIVYLTPTIIIIAWANIIRTQYLIPYMKDKVYIYSIITGAALNIIFNIIAIPRFGAAGAALGTVIAELSVASYQIWAVRNELDIVPYMKGSLIYIISGFLMYLGVITFSFHASFNAWIMIVLEVIIGATIYLSLIAIYLTRIRKVNLKKLIMP